MRNLLNLAIGLLLAMSCKVSGPPTFTNSSLSNYQEEQITKSLFDSKESTITEDNIKKLLEGKILLPASIRVALFNYENTSLNRYYMHSSRDEEYLKLKQNYVDTLIWVLRDSPKVEKTILMPSLLVASNPSLTNLRESAVRLQSDVLVIFSIKSDIYYKYRAFKKDEAKAYATIETLFLDVRTGVIPFSNIITKEKLIQKEEGDLDITETQKRAESEAIILALTESAKGIKDYLSEQNR